MQVQRHVSLRPYNTFGMDVAAEMFTEITGIAQLEELSDDTSLPARHVLGGGSNILLTKAVTGLVLHNQLKGIRRILEDDTHVWLEVQSGEIWHDLVMYAIENNLAGLENLALIPGTTGAAPIQNIGAYGMEVRELITLVTGWHWEEKRLISYTNEECRFGYRDSIFKQELSGRIFITSVIFKLSRQPNFKTTYGAISQELERMKITELSIRAIADAVISIRRSKLPDPLQTGNAGSFFKNPVVSATQFKSLQENFPEIPYYPVSDQWIKLPAGWLIEQCGWKGYRKGDAGVHEKQALVLVNYARANGSEIWELSAQILRSVRTRFGIELEREVQVW